MKTITEPAPPVTPEPSPISLVPPPTAEEQLATANADLEELRRWKEDAGRKNAALLDKLADLERNHFNFTMSNIDAGSALMEAGDKIKTLSAACMRLQEKGSFTLKLSVKPQGTALDFSAEIKVTEPKQDPVHSFFYADEEGNLSRQDPRQKEFRFSRGDRSPEGSDDRAYAEERRDPQSR